MQGSIRVALGMTLLFLAASVNDTLPDAQFLAWALGFAIPGALIGLSGARAMARAQGQSF